MNNFFYDSSDFILFKKALRKTGGEPVVINILSSDSSLKKKEEVVEKKQVRKNFSSRFEPSPFGKFFGPTKQKPRAVDTNNFSSWKNKNYRNAEKSIEENPETNVKFSLSDFMNNKFGKTKFNEMDTAKSNLQKPITQISSDDPQMKRFSLDSFITKLEQQKHVEEELKLNDDILEPLGESTQSVVPDSSQDEDFGYDNDEMVNKVVYDDNIEGSKFKFDKDELDKIKARLMKIEEDQANLKKKTNEKRIEGNELSDLSKDDFNYKKLGFEVDDEEDETPIEEEVETVSEEQEQEEVKEERVDPLKNYRKNKEENIDENSETKIKDEKEKTDLSDSNIEKTTEELSERLDKIESSLKDENDHEESDREKTEEIRKDDILTKKEFKTMTNELMDRFSQMYQKSSEEKSEKTAAIQQTNTDQEDNELEENQKYLQAMKLERKQAELQSKIAELIETNKQNDKNAQQRIEQMEAEKQQIAEQYALKLKEIEESYSKQYEDYKKKVYLEKINSEANSKKSKASVEENSSQIKSRKKGSLKKELKTSLDKSNNEMDKKLLEVASELNKNEKIKQRRQTRKSVSVETLDEKDALKVDSNNLNIDLPKPKPTKRRRKKSSRHRIDGDIMSDVDFE